MLGESDSKSYLCRVKSVLFDFLQGRIVKHCEKGGPPTAFLFLFRQVHIHIVLRQYTRAEVVHILELEEHGVPSVQ